MFSLPVGRWCVDVTQPRAFSSLSPPLHRLVLFLFVEELSSCFLVSFVLFFIFGFLIKEKPRDIAVCVSDLFHPPCVSRCIHFPAHSSSLPFLMAHGVLIPRLSAFASRGVGWA